MYFLRKVTSNYFVTRVPTIRSRASLHSEALKVRCFPSSIVNTLSTRPYSMSIVTAVQPRRGSHRPSMFAIGFSVASLAHGSLNLIWLVLISAVQDVSGDNGGQQSVVPTWWNECLLSGSANMSIKDATDDVIKCCGSLLGCECVNQVQCPLHPEEESCKKKCASRDCQAMKWTVKECLALKDRPWIVRNSWIWLVLAGIALAILLLVAIYFVYRKKFANKKGKKHGKKDQLGFGTHMALESEVVVEDDKKPHHKKKDEKKKDTKESVVKAQQVSSAIGGSSLGSAPPESQAKNCVLKVSQAGEAKSVGASSQIGANPAGGGKSPKSIRASHSALVRAVL